MKKPHKASKRSLGDRMKGYEDAHRIYLPKRMPCIVRVDGKAFHTLTKDLDRPWDEHFANAMLATARELCLNMQGATMAFWQSDEISILLADYSRLTSEAWFDKNLQKMVSVSASVATAAFNHNMPLFKHGWDKIGHFDSRAFVLPKEEVCNYFLWRQRDATTNSIQMVGQHNFSHKELQGLSNAEVQEKLFQEKKINWSSYDTWKKRGACIIEDSSHATKWKPDLEIPIFSEDREYINSRVNVEETE